MNVRIEADGTAVVEFASPAEIDAAIERDLAAGGILLRTSASLPLFSETSVVLCVSGGGRARLHGTVVNHLPGAVAVAFAASPDELRAALEAMKAPAPAPAEDESPERDAGVWERVRGMSRNEKLLLAAKASRAERAVLAQDTDAQILYFLLKNPRITVEEVSRIAKTTSLSAPAADLIARTSQWTSSLDVRTALVNNPRCPPALALKLLPTLPETEIRKVAKATAVSQQLKQAALRIVVNKQ